MSKNAKVEQGEATSRELVEIAKGFFSEKGYADTSTTEIVKAAGVTRGALYHHFADKEALFRAVLETAMAEIGGKILEAVNQSDDPWEQLIEGCKAFLASSADPLLQRIVMIDAPSVLGRDTWRKIDEESTTRLLAEQLQIMMDAGIIQPLPVMALTHLLSGGMNEAALWIAEADDPQQALQEAQDSLETLLNALRQT